MPVLSYSGEYPWVGVVGAQAVGVARQTASWIQPGLPGYGPRHRALLIVPPNGPQKQYMRRFLVRCRSICGIFRQKRATPSIADHG